MTKIKFWILSKYTYCQTMELELSLFFFFFISEFGPVFLPHKSQKHGYLKEKRHPCLS